MNKTMYCTLDNETFGGAACPKGSYHLGGIIHDNTGNIYGCFNYIIMENYNEIKTDKYAKKNFERYSQMLNSGNATIIDTEDHAVEMVEAILKYYNVKYVMAYNSAFDFNKTKCYKLVENREFIDIWLMALETIISKKSYSTFCHKNNLKNQTGRSVSTTAQTVYAFLTNSPDYVEEHTALEDSKIEMEIFLACIRCHKKYTKNIHCMNAQVYYLFPRW